jgi:hypothetical protein
MRQTRRFKKKPPKEGGSSGPLALVLVQQRKREHRRDARTIVYCSSDGERTNRDSESSDKLEYNPGHRVPLFCRGP